MVNKNIILVRFREHAAIVNAIFLVDAPGFVSFIVHAVNIPYSSGKCKGGSCKNFPVGWVVYKKIN